MPNTETAEDLDFTTYAGKPATDLQARFADWLIEKVGVSFSNKKEEAAWREGVRLGVALRIPFQRSPENQTVREALASAPKPEKAPKAEKAEKVAKPAKKVKAAPVADAEPVEDEPVAVAKAPKPKKAARTGAKAPF